MYMDLPTLRCFSFFSFFGRKDQLTGRWDSVTTLLVKRKATLQTLLHEWQDFCALRDGWSERVQLVMGRLAPQVWDATVRPAQAVEKQLQVVEVRHFLEICLFCEWC